MAKYIAFNCFLIFSYASLYVSQAISQEEFERPLIKYLGSWGEKGTQEAQFSQPEGMTIDPSGNVYIADTGNNRIQKLTLKGQFICEVGGFGWDKNQFHHPVAVEAPNGLDVFVADYNNQRIERYDKDLNYIATLVSINSWSEYHQFGFPLDVGVSNQGELFCLDGENNRILKLDVFGNPQISFGDFDSAQGRLISPKRLLVSQSDKLYVSDENRQCILVYDNQGNFLNNIGEDQLLHPWDMIKANNDYLFVADLTSRAVFVFNQNGRFMESISRILSGLTNLEEPVDVEYWQQTILILDKKRCVVEMFLWSY